MPTSLLHYNTFIGDVQAAELVECATVDEVREALFASKNKPLLVLGGGSNVLFLSDFHGVVLRPTIADFDVVAESQNTVDVRVGAGVEWDVFVERCVQNGWQGVENLSLIPGTVGASPVQNIGAYGVEAGDVILRVEGVMVADGKAFKLEACECEFGYRNSIFKGRLKGQIVITHVTFQLHKTTSAPNLDYGPVRQAVEALGQATIDNVRQAVINIRQAKLPDHKIEGNAGSFFKNPEINLDLFAQLLSRFPDMPSYDVADGKRKKIPAGWLIERSGWKGKSLGRAGIHARQALVVVNRGGATGAEILAIAKAVKNDVGKTFGIDLEMEVNCISG